MYIHIIASYHHIYVHVLKIRTGGPRRERDPTPTSLISYIQQIYIAVNQLSFVFW